MADTENLHDLADWAELYHREAEDCITKQKSNWKGRSLKRNRSALRVHLDDFIQTATEKQAKRLANSSTFRSTVDAAARAGRIPGGKLFARKVGAGIFLGKCMDAFGLVQNGQLLATIWDIAIESKVIKTDSAKPGTKQMKKELKKYLKSETSELFVNEDFADLIHDELVEEFGTEIAEELVHEALHIIPYLGQIYNSMRGAYKADKTLNAVLSVTMAKAQLLHMIVLVNLVLDMVQPQLLELEGSSKSSPVSDGRIPGYPRRKFLEFSLKKTLRGHEEDVASVAFSPDGRCIASGSIDETIKIWETKTGRLKQTMTHKYAVTSVAYSPDGCRIASGAFYHKIKIWDTATGQLQQKLKGPNNTLDFRSAMFSPDGRYLAAIAWELDVRFFKATTGELLWTIDEDQIISLVFSPDGSCIATGGFDQTVKLWHTSTGRYKQTLTGHNKPVFSVQFSSDGRYIASASGDNSIKVWEVVTGKVQQTMQHSGVETIVFSPDGCYIASSSEADNTVKIWEVATGRVKQTLKGHEDNVKSVVFSPDGRSIASGSADQTIKLWAVAS